MRTNRTLQNRVTLKWSSAGLTWSCALVIAAGLASTGCEGYWFSSGGNATDLNNSSSGGSSAADLNKFDSEGAFKEYLAVQVEEEPSRWELAYQDPDFVAAVEPEAPAGDADADLDVWEAEADFSTTNIQEDGVDESDVVKSDGTYLYILSSNRVNIVRAVPADEMELVATVELSVAPQELYLRNDTLVAVGNRPDNYQLEPWDVALETSESAGSDHRGTVVTIVDVSDRSAPLIVATIEAEGWLNTSRLIGSKLHLVLSAWPTLPPTLETAPALPADNAIVTADVDDLLPDLTVTMANEKSTTRNLVEWRDFYRPGDPDGYQMTTVVTIDVDAPGEPVRSVGILANAGVVYVSPRALYITDIEFDRSGDPRVTTDIYKFDLHEDGAVLAGVGRIPGRLHNRFSMGEYQGYLRTATTLGRRSPSGQRERTNNLYVLAQENRELVVVGSLEDIAPGERVYSARFIGDRGFLVTSMRVSPLFTLDLSDPLSPKAVGEFTVPGYSEYIHPLGENHLLTIGKDAVELGDWAVYQGVQISVFDVTDFAAPQLVDAEIVGDRGTESEALYNPHAFNYFASQDMLAVPMVIAELSESESDDPWAKGDPVFAGLLLYRITTDEGVEPIARMASGPEDDIYRYWGSWMRGIFIGDYIYAVTDAAVMAAPLNAPSVSPFQLPLE